MFILVHSVPIPKAPILLQRAENVFLMGVSEEWKDDEGDNFVVYEVASRWELSEVVPHSICEMKVKGVRWIEDATCKPKGKGAKTVVGNRRMIRVAESKHSSDFATCGFEMKDLVLADWADIWVVIHPARERFLAGRKEVDSVLFVDEKECVLEAYLSLDKLLEVDAGNSSEFDL